MARKILCVFAHPDDEATVGPLLAMRAAEGTQVTVVSVTAGQMGMTPNTNLAAGDALGAARTEELRQACACLGIEPPVVLAFLDGSIAHRHTVAQLVDELRAIVAQHQPDDVITFGPEGASGHTDHRIVSSAVTEVFQQQGCSATRLYYLTYPHSRLYAAQSALKKPLLSRLMEDAFITDVIDCRVGLDAAESALRCHKTQWSPALMDAWNILNRELLEGKVYLRLAMERR